MYYGAVATYDHPFSTSDKDAFTANMLLLGMVKGGVVTYASILPTSSAMCSRSANSKHGRPVQKGLNGAVPVFQLLLY